MKSSVAKQGPNEKLVEVEISEEELTPHFDSVYRKYQKSVRLEGFRKGKVPLGLIKKLYGDHIRHEAIDEVVQSVFREVMAQEDIRPVAPARLEDIKYEPGSGLRFKAVVEVVPDIEIKHINRLSVEREIYELDDEDIDAAVEDIREQMAVMQPVEEPAEENHFVLADFQQIDKTGVPIIGKKFEDRFFQLSRDGNKELTDRLIGIKTGETRRVELPVVVENPANEEKTELYDISVKEIQLKQLPEIDDELAKDAGDFETLEDLKADVRNKLATQAQRNTRRSLRQRLIDELLKRNSFDLPESMITGYLDAIVEGARKQSKGEVDEEALRREYRAGAIWNLRWEMAKARIAEQENIVVTDQDKEDFISRMADERGVDDKQLRSSLNNKKAKSRFEEDVLEAKVLDLIERNAKIKEKKITRRDIEKARQLTGVA